MRSKMIWHMWMARNLSRYRL